MPSRSTDCTASGTCSTANKRLDLTYSFDANGNVSQIVDGVNGRQTRGMSYDGLDRLVQTTSNMFGTASYSYDVLDNLTRVQVGASSNYAARDHYYCYSSNRLASVRTSSCSGTVVNALAYDVQGNLYSKDSTQYRFDFGNRLRTVNTTAALYDYDGLGRRVRDKVNGTPKVSQYTQGGQLAMTADNRAGKVTEYFYLQGSLVAWRERDTTTNVHTVRYQHTDALGTPIATTDANKAIMERFEYEPYGRQVSGAAKDGPGYTGHVQDAATGLTYMQQRYYDPQLQIFISRDTITALSNPVGQFNAYRYANNNPYRFTDPDGRCPMPGSPYCGQSMENIQAMAAAQSRPAGGVGDAVFRTVLEFTPIAGDRIAIGEAIREPTAINITAAAIGLAGPVGDGVAKAIKGADKAISMEKAIDAGIRHVGPNADVVMTRGGNVQFTSTTTDAAGNTVTTNARFDVNPSSGHVQRQGPHLNLETQVNGKKVGVDPHIPIKPETTRRGDYD